MTSSPEEWSISSMTYAFLNNSTHITFSLDGVGRVGKEENK